MANNKSTKKSAQKKTEKKPGLYRSRQGVSGFCALRDEARRVAY